MAANGGDNNNHGYYEGQWPFDPLNMVPGDFDDDVIHLLDVPGGLYSPPAAPPPLQNVVGNNCSYGGDPLDLVPVPGSNDTSAPQAAGGGTPAMAGPSTSAHRQDDDASSSYVHQGAQLDCTGCQILREVMHTNGFETTKFCIHGAAAQFYHATVEVYHANPDGFALAPTHQFFVDFMDRDYAWVKHYLMVYAQHRAAGGCTVVHDSTSDFIDALCTTMPGGALLEDRREAPAQAAEAETGAEVSAASAGDDVVKPIIIGQEEMPLEESPGPTQPSNNVVARQEQQVVCPPVRSRFAIQRERTKKLELHDISRYFHLPMAKACKELGVCATVLKGLRRTFGIERWPHRKIQKIDNEIAKLRENSNGSSTSMDMIQKLTNSRRDIINGLSGLKESTSNRGKRNQRLD